MRREKQKVFCLSNPNPEGSNFLWKVNSLKAEFDVSQPSNAVFRPSRLKCKNSKISSPEEHFDIKRN